MDKFFSVFGKVILILLVLGIFIGGGFYLGNRSTNQTIPPVYSSPSPSPSQTQTATTPTAQTQTKIEKGSIEGTLGYPAEGIPPLFVYAFNATDHSKYFFTKTGQNVSTFTIPDLDPATYVVVAYPQNPPSPGLAGGYSKAVPCGLSVSCTDHSLIPVTVQSGQTAKDVAVKDWYAPANTFPSKPN